MMLNLSTHLKKFLKIFAGLSFVPLGVVGVTGAVVELFDITVGDASTGLESLLDNILIKSILNSNLSFVSIFYLHSISLINYRSTKLYLSNLMINFIRAMQYYNHLIYAGIKNARKHDKMQFFFGCVNCFLLCNNNLLHLLTATSRENYNKKKCAVQYILPFTI